MAGHTNRSTVARAYVAVASLVALAGTTHAADWTQWGGPERNFSLSDAKTIAPWPADGPKTLWRRPLGEGYSTIVAADETLYTMYRDGEDEVVVALDAGTGETRWERRYPAPLPEKAILDFGKGPNATPLIAGDRLITIGFAGQMFCLNRTDGKPIWAVDLVVDLGGNSPEFGYSNSPLLHNGLVIVPVGAKGKSIVALSLEDGEVKWASADFANSYSSPVLVDVGGRKQIVLVMTKEIIGLDADSGRLAWSHPYKNQWDTHCGTVVDCGGGVVFAPSFGGGVALELISDGDTTRVKERWTTKRLGAGQSNVILSDGHLYGAGGSDRAAFYGAFRMSDGEQTWRERMPIANTLRVGQTLLTLDEDGKLALLKLTPEKLEKLAEAQVLGSAEPAAEAAPTSQGFDGSPKGKIWTAPTLVGSHLYVRDAKEIAALELNLQ